MGERRQPNILFLFSDQHAQRVAGAYGDPVAETPALDRLAAEGVTFESCYTPSPICMPARMAMLTARHPHRNGVWTNNDVLASDIPTYAHALGAAGVRTSLVGRLHALGPDQWHGFERRLVGDHSPAWPGVGRHDMGILRRTHGPNRVSVERCGPGNSAYQDLDEATTEAALAELDRLAAARAGGGAPFFLSVGFMLPHPPYVARAEDYARFAGRVPPPCQPEPPADEHPWLAWWRDNRRLADLPPGNVAHARAAYYGLVRRLDIHLGRLLERLDASGLAGETLVVYASDHGDHLGERGLWWKHTFFEESVKVPLILRWPGVLPKGERRDRVVDLLDVAAGLLEAAGAPRLPGADGRSLLPVARDKAAPWTDEVFSEYCVDASQPYAGDRATQQRMVRRGRWKLIHIHGHAPMLFDLEDDPQETRNRAADPSCAAVRDALLARVLEGWDPEAVAATLEARVPARALLRAWAEAVRPADPIRWQFDPDINRLDRES